MKRITSAVAALLLFSTVPVPARGEPGGWTTGSPRPEIAPKFAHKPDGGPDGRGGLVVETDGREGLAGYWTRTFPVKGGATYRFSASRRASGLRLERVNAVVEIHWTDDKGGKVPLDAPSPGGYMKGSIPTAETEYPASRPAGPDGWTLVAGDLPAPKAATRAEVRLHLRWAPNARVEWGAVEFVETSPVAPRTVRLATVHYVPKGGKSPKDNREQFKPFVEQAARAKADLVVLGETLTYPGLGKSYVDVAEPIPGPSTEYFGRLAKDNDLHIVAGLLERDGNLVYNVAVLIDPDGKIAGKYRKVCLPRGEVDGGIAPGTDYPVFQTRFGKVGMMICYDGFFPEVARELTNRGAEVIAWPVWGCNPLLARSRACENHVYLVSSTYTDVSADWTISAVYDHYGEPIARAGQWGSVAVAEVDLNKTTRWVSLGDFRAQLPSHRPAPPRD